ncbi:MAG: three-Cys-motif partner protein TcmP [Ferruginibacter sp.]
MHYEEFGKLSFRNKDYKEIVPKLSNYFKGLKNEKAFIFIDPYGYKEIRASEIKSLLESKKSEVLLFLPTQFMYRFDENGTPQALIEILEELVDIKDWKATNSVYAFIEQFNNALRKYLGDDFFVDSFTIEKDEKTVFVFFSFQVISEDLKKC